MRAPQPTKEIVLVDDNGEMAREVWNMYLPNKVVAHGNGKDNDLPLLDGRTPVDGKPTAYVCENMLCNRPVTSVAELKQLLDEPVSK